MDIKIVIDKVKELLKTELAKDPKSYNIDRVENFVDLTSVLRDRVFHSDAKTEKFLKSILDSEVVVLKPKKTELTEAEFGELILKSLEKSLKEKSCKFKYAKHYFSTEKDLVITILDQNDFESVYRVMTIKAT
jgi:hypothetical protein